MDNIYYKPIKEDDPAEQVLEGIRRIAKMEAIREVKRVIKPGGRFALREGGLRPRFLPVDIGIADPGLEYRLEVAFDQWFQRFVRQGDGVVRYPHGWTQLLTDGGFTNVSARTFILELLPPFSHVQVEFMLNLLKHWVDSDERAAFITGDDAEAIKRLTDPPRALTTRSAAVTCTTWKR